ncbi:AAA family ATPase [Tamaricihabitans halophyticus]|uniref:AAA family ATPase n=1 Tax=Tamaricihabitans halophyticus TaxID=1262583 RepID=UPI001FB2B4BE|nr:AAA family ATPase [Tamaricihabitans halophyticus]
MNLLICAGCGELAERPRLAEQAPEAAVLWCIHCGHRAEFRRLPLFCVTGPSGTGKSTVCRRLPEALGGKAVVVEQDVLWLAGLRELPDGHPRFRAAWLQLAAMINQSGRPMVLCGTVAPEEIEERPERVLLGAVHYLALVCDSAVLAERLRQRPAWREWDEQRIAETLEFNEWLRTEAPAVYPDMTLVDTTERTVDDTLAQVTSWFATRND